jgi:uncharacterized membrane protein YraQ (UPF0718 family)
VVQRGWLGENILRKNRTTQVRTIPHIVMDGVRRIRERLADLLVPNFGIVPGATIALEAAVCCDVVQQTPGSFEPTHQPQVASMSTGVDNPSLSLPIVKTETSTCDTTCSGEPQVETPFWRRLVGETWTATTMVIKFMLLAWFVGALVKLYVPEEWITGILSGDNPWSIMTAAFLGVPVYTSNLAAMPLVGGLLVLGMHPAAALAFLIAGPITTLPAMSAVWGLVNRKVFALYIGFALVGAVLLGYAYNIALRL